MASKPAKQVPQGVMAAQSLTARAWYEAIISQRVQAWQKEKSK
jgi:hypothetical protein